MSDLDESALTDDDQFGEQSTAAAGQDYDASGDAASASYNDDDEHGGGGGLSPERGAGFSDDDGGYDGGARGGGGGGDNDESRIDGAASYDDGHGHGDDYDDYADGHGLGDGGDDGGDPSSIHAPAGASAAASDAAARLARLMAADQGGEGDDDDDELEQRMARKREIAALEAQLQRTGTGTGTASRNSSKRASAKAAAAVREEKEAASTSASASQRPSQHASYRSAAAHADDLLDEDLDNMDDEFDDDDEYNGHSDGESEYGHGGHGHGHGGGHGGDVDSDDEIRTAEDVARAKEEREHLIEVNKIRQKQIALILERERQSHGGGGKSGSRGGPSAGGVGGSGGGGGLQDDKHGLGLDGSGLHPEQIRVEYLKNLENLNLLWDELESRREDAEARIDRLTSKLDAADERAAELSDSFKSFKREISKEARFSRTGRPIKLKRILAFEAAEEAADRDVARVRLRHINLLNELRVLEDAVRTKEKLAEGLHLIDFEQLKIENQTLNEKIEERNDDLHKLKKKTTTTVQVLTHIKEKLQCVREENAISAAEVDKLNAAVSALRDELTRAKQGRDESRSDNQLLKQKQGFIGSDLLVSDFENRKGDIEVLRAEVEALKARWRALNSLAARAASVERSHARFDSEQAIQRQTHYATVKFGGAQGAAAAASAAAMGTAHSRR